MGIRDGRLSVRVNNELVLDAGFWSEEKNDEGSVWRVVRPPESLMFDQILNYLSDKAAPSPAAVTVTDEGRAAVAICIRWGSYMAVITDNDKPPYKAPHGKKSGRISDSEMARINIESSTALERWIEIKRNEPRRYRALVAASRYLPLTVPERLSAHIKTYALLKALAYPPPDAPLPEGWPGPASMSEDKWAATHERPTRVLANALINFCWRNGPIENVHGNQVPDIEKYPVCPLPLLQRRVTPGEEKELMKVSVKRFAGAFEILDELISEDYGRGWVERVLPFNTSVASLLLISPSNWSTTEQTRAVYLYGSEPQAAGRAVSRLKRG